MIVEKTKGMVTDFKRFAVHDGDGIRTTVFLKGCPLNCLWCHNPESISPLPQLSFFSDKCTLCGQCIAVCPVHAHNLTNGRHILHRETCIVCGKCAEVCMNHALKIEGKHMTVIDVLDLVEEDVVFYGDNGGMTLSGGEPAMQPGFTLALLKEAKRRKINTALDTCGFAKREIYEEFLPYVDTFLYDIKHITEEGHRRCTGYPNGRILENLRFLSNAGAKIEILMPVVPGYNDDAVTLQEIGKLLASLSITKMKLLPYHSYARSKYEALSIPDTMPVVERPGMEKMESIAKQLRSYDIPVIVG